jgi:hypothetical protein
MRDGWTPLSRFAVGCMHADSCGSLLVEIRQQVRVFLLHSPHVAIGRVQRLLSVRFWTNDQRPCDDHEGRLVHEQASRRLIKNDIVEVHDDERPGSTEGD